MDQVNRLLNINQKLAVEELFKKVNESEVLYALYVKLIFDITKIWYSFTSVPDEFSSLIGINEAIEYIFESIEDDYGLKMPLKELSFLKQQFSNLLIKLSVFMTR